MWGNDFKSLEQQCSSFIDIDPIKNGATPLTSIKNTYESVYLRLAQWAVTFDPGASIPKLIGSFFRFCVSQY